MFRKSFPSGHSSFSAYFMVFLVVSGLVKYIMCKALISWEPLQTVRSKGCCGKRDTSTSFKIFMGPDHPESPDR